MATLAGITVRHFNRRAAKLVQHGHITGQKAPGKAYYGYSLNDTQLAAFRLRRALAQGQALPAPELETSTYDDIPARLRFLRTIQARTVFGGHAMLELVIGHYERALGRQRASGR